MLDEQPYTNFNPNRCNVCFTRANENRLNTVGQKLRFCKGCRMIGYCGERHQKEDWKYHKDFCRAITRILTTKGIEHILNIRDDSGSIIGKTKRDLECVISLSECMLVSIVQRSLYQHEYKLIRFPNICRVCFEYDSSKLEACKVCHQVLYCGNEHRWKDAENHARWCEMYRVNFLLDSNYTVRGPETGDFPKLTASNLWTFPKNSFDLVNTAYRINIKATPITNQDFDNLKFVSNFSYVGTILDALYTTNMNVEIQQSLVIYIVGAENELVYFCNDTCSIIFTYLPQVRDVVIHFIGPSICMTDNEVMLNYKGDRTVKMHYHKGLYHMLDNRGYWERPQVVVSYNCGFHEHMESLRDTWRPTLIALIRFVNIPIIFTSYTRDEACQDCATVQKINQRLVKKRDLVFVKRAANNPFKDYKPFRNTNFTDERDELYYANGYISLIISRVP